MLKPDSLIYIAVQTQESKIFALKVFDFEINLSSKRGTFFIIKKYNSGFVFQLKSKKNQKSEKNYYLAINIGGFYLTEKKSCALWINPKSGVMSNSNLIFKIADIDELIKKVLCKINPKFLILNPVESSTQNTEDIFEDLIYEDVNSNNIDSSVIVDRCSQQTVVQQQISAPVRVVSQSEIKSSQNVVVPSFNPRTVSALNQRDGEICRNNNGVWVTDVNGRSYCNRCTMGSEYPDPTTGTCLPCPANANCGDYGSCYGKTNPPEARCILVNNKYITSCSGVNNCGGSCNGYCAGSLFGMRCVRDTNGNYICKFADWWKLLLWIFFIFVLIGLIILIVYSVKKKPVPKPVPVPVQGPECIQNVKSFEMVSPTTQVKSCEPRQNTCQINQCNPNNQCNLNNNQCNLNNPSSTIEIGNYCNRGSPAKPQIPQISSIFGPKKF